MKCMTRSQIPFHFTPGLIVHGLINNIGMVNEGLDYYKKTWRDVKPGKVLPEDFYFHLRQRIQLMQENLGYLSIGLTPRN